MKWITVLVVLASLAGCAPRMSTPELEAKVVTMFDEGAAEKGLKIHAKKAMLVYDQGNTYKGTISISDGQEISIEVTYDGKQVSMKPTS